MTKKEDKTVKKDNSKDEVTKTPPSEFSLLIDDGLSNASILFKDKAVATLEKSASALNPSIALIDDSLPKAEKAASFLKKAQSWLTEHIESNLKSLTLLDKEINQGAKPEDKAAALTNGAKDIASSLLDHLGIMDRSLVEEKLKGVSTDERKALWRFKIKIGASTIFIPYILKPAPTQLRLLLWALFTKKSSLPQPPVPGMVWVDMGKNISPDFYRLSGYRPAGKKAVRVDMVERLADAVRPQGLKGASFQVSPEIMGLVGLSGEDFANVMNMIGYQSRKHAAPKTKDGKDETEASEFYSFTWVGVKKPKATIPTREIKVPTRKKIGGGSTSRKPKVPKRAKTGGSTSRQHEAWEPDPSSPFAALSVLRNTMKKKSKDK